MKVLASLLVLTLFILPANASRLHQESAYQSKWCSANNGRMEVVLGDKARVDCVTPTHAIEFDFANKWAESLGQSLYYSIITCKKPGIVLIIENPQKEQQYIKRLQKVALKQNIDYWLMYEGDLFK